MTVNNIGAQRVNIVQYGCDSELKYEINVVWVNVISAVSVSETALHSREWKRDGQTWSRQILRTRAGCCSKAGRR